PFLCARSTSILPPSPSDALGVLHPAIVAVLARDLYEPLVRVTFLASSTIGVGHPPKPLPDVRRTDARSAQIGGPEGISHCFQVSTYSGEPFTSISARNLLSKDNWGSALVDEPAPRPP